MSHPNLQLRADILHALRSLSNQQGTAPEILRIMQQSCSLESVRNNLKKLMTAGQIERIERPGSTPLYLSSSRPNLSKLPCLPYRPMMEAAEIRGLSKGDAGRILEAMEGEWR